MATTRKDLRGRTPVSYTHLEGRNLFEENKVIFNQRKDKAVEEICKHVGFIK